MKDPGDGSPSETVDSEEEWRVATAQAENAAKNRGDLPGGLARSVDGVVRPTADWRDVLREFVSARAKSDFSWARPNRRFISQGLYLPGLHSEELGNVVIAIDTSGSIGQAELEKFGNEVNGVLGAFDCTATIVYADTRPQQEVEHKSTDGDIKLQGIGGGGTSHAWLPGWLAKREEPPACVICLTDGFTVYPPELESPCLWALTTNGGTKPPFGRVINING